MKITRFLWNGQARWGVVVEDTICALEGDLWGTMEPGAAICPLLGAKLLAPVEPHNKAIGLGLTYKGMYARYEAWQGKARRDGPAVFMKPPNSIVGHMAPIVHHDVCTGVIYEAEVGIVMGKVAARVSSDEALEYVAGYTCVNDVTAAGFMTVERPIVSTRFKICDTFCPTGPVVETEVEDPAALTVLCRVNGDEVERSTTGPDMCYTMGECIAWVTSFMTLMPGDIIATGSNGTGRIEVGDVVEVEVEGVGVLTNPVVAP